MIEFNATVHKVSTDRDGEVTVTFKVPMIDKNQAIGLSILTKTSLKVMVMNPATEKGK